MPCDSRSFAAGGAKECTRCPANTEVVSGLGTTIDECGCRRGECAESSCRQGWPFAECDEGPCAEPVPGTGAYTETNRTGVACSSCPEGGHCAGGTALPLPATDYSGVEYPLDGRGAYYVPSTRRTAPKSTELRQNFDHVFMTKHAHVSL